jgi:pyruvate dehydrogenase E2 component (dihydrolipoamide acetyltransferase)
VDVAGRRIRHRVLGCGGEVIALLHGFGGRLEQWSGLQAALATGNRSVAALDLPGHGESSVDVGSGSLDELAGFVRGYLDATGIGRVHLVGHSMGAALGLVLADLEPRRVRSLALLGPAGFGQRINADFIRGFVAARSPAALEPLLRLCYGDPSLVTDEVVAQAADYKGREGVVEALTRIASSRYAATPSGRSLREVAGSVPTLVVWGDADRIVPPPPGGLVQQGVEFHLLPGRGHMLQVEAVPEVAALVEGLLAKS